MAKKTPEKIKCECCGKEVTYYPNRIFCNKCAIYIRNLKIKISYLTCKVKKLNLKIYGVENGLQRNRKKVLSYFDKEEVPDTLTGNDDKNKNDNKEVGDGNPTHNLKIKRRKKNV